MLYNNNDTSFEDVKANLMSKEKFDLEAHTKKGEGLSVRVNPLIKETPLDQSLRDVSPINPIVIIESQGK